MRNANLIAGIIVVILIGAVFFLVRSRLPQFNLPNRTTPAAKPSPITIAENSITTSKHTPSSKAVIDSVILRKPGFVVIAENDNGKPGVILGVSQLLQSGSHQNLVIDLSRKTRDGESLLAVVHSDNGDGKFDAATDEMIKNENGNPIQAAFQISSQSDGFQIPATGLGEDDK